MTEPVDSQSRLNRHLLAAMITLAVLVILAGVYLNRRGGRRLARMRARATAEVLEDWPRGGVAASPVALTHISYKNIVSRIAPSVVSVNVEAPAFVGQADGAQPVAFGRGSGLNPWCPPGARPAANQPADQSASNLGAAQYVWGGRMGGAGLGPIGTLVCPTCSTTIPHNRGVPAYAVSCPNCGTSMTRQGAGGLRPLPGQTQPMANAPAAGGGYLGCPNCWTTTPCPPGVQAGAVGCPSCGMWMQRMAGAGVAVQPAATGGGYQFQAPARSGSGVIVNALGYVLTNHHVIHGAKRITVTVSWDKVTKTYPADVIDEAPALDLAIVKILTKTPEQFAAAPIGVSSAASVGDEVLALGSPFGLSQTVTFGIISNTSRTLTVGKMQFNDFFQTDAPINPGSSGGPLVNVRGEVIAINTAIYSPTQAFSGVGFASPIDPAKAAFPEFIDLTGSSAAGTLVREAPNWLNRRLTPVATAPPPADRRCRGGLLPWCPAGAQLRPAAAVSPQGGPWLGILAATLDGRTKAVHQLPRTLAKGVVVLDVFALSPAAAAGLQAGDVIRRLDGRSIKDPAMLAGLLARRHPADTVTLTVYRAGSRLTLPLTLATRPPGAAALAQPNTPTQTLIQAQAVAQTATGPFDPTNAPPPGLKGVLQGGEVGAGEIEALGMGVEDLAPELALAFGIPKGVEGVIIAESANQAEAAGLLAGDVIQAINNQRVRSVVDFIKVMNVASLTQGITLDINRQGQRFQVTMKG